MMRFGGNPPKALNRRHLLAGIAAVTATKARAQPAAKIYRVGVLTPSAPPLGQLEALREGLGELGYVEGQNIAFEWRFGGGSNEALPRLARELVEAKVDVIVAINTTPAQAAKKATTTIPIVFTRLGDPVRTGLVKSLARTDANLTGITSMPEEVMGKRLEFLKDTLPGASRIAALYSGGNRGADVNMDELGKACLRLKLELLRLPALGPEDFERVIEAATVWKANALFVQDDAAITDQSTKLLALTNANRLPVFGQYRPFAEAGAVVTYGPDIPAMYRRTAYFVDRILKGAQPQDLPVERPTKIVLIVNQKAAKALGLAIPPPVLALADEVIE